MKYSNSLSLFFLTFAGLLCGILFFRKDTHVGLTEQEFINLKFAAKQDNDIVFAGDSRILCDINPDIFEKQLHLKTLNFGFNFLGYSKDYLDSVKCKLNINSRRKIIVLGITPRSLTPLNQKVSEFRGQKEKSKFEKFEQLYFSKTLTKFAPISISSIFFALKNQKIFREYNLNGWMPIEVIPPDESESIKTYTKLFNYNQVSEAVINNILVFVDECTQQRIEVYGFRPPVSETIYALEVQEKSGFNHKKFINDFEQKGGRWLEFNSRQFEYADGSHLSRPFANTFCMILSDSLSNNAKDVTNTKN